MNRKGWSGLLGLIVGGVWLVSNFKHVDKQGFVAVGMPLVLIVAGAIYVVRSRKK